MTFFGLQNVFFFFFAGVSRESRVATFTSDVSGRQSRQCLRAALKQTQLIRQCQTFDNLDEPDGTF